MDSGNSVLRKLIVHLVTLFKLQRLHSVMLCVMILIWQKIIFFFCNELLQYVARGTEEDRGKLKSGCLLSGLRLQPTISTIRRRFESYFTRFLWRGAAF